jgi:hypothetical protein
MSQLDRSAAMLTGYPVIVAYHAVRAAQHDAEPGHPTQACHVCDEHDATMSQGQPLVRCGEPGLDDACLQRAEFAFADCMTARVHAPPRFRAAAVPELSQIVEALRRTPSPVSPIHRSGVCDPSPAFRAAVNDVFNIVSGLTLYDVSGKSHGWALLRHKEKEPQPAMTLGLNRMAGLDRGYHSVGTKSQRLCASRCSV